MNILYFMSWDPDHSRFMDKFLPHLRTEPDKFLYRFRDAFFTEKAIDDARLRRVVFGDEKALQNLMILILQEKLPRTADILLSACHGLFLTIFSSVSYHRHAAVTAVTQQANRGRCAELG